MVDAVMLGPMLPERFCVILAEFGFTSLVLADGGLYLMLDVS
jgi:hypothetical protein